MLGQYGVRKGQANCPLKMKLKINKKGNKWGRTKKGTKSNSENGPKKKSEWKLPEKLKFNYKIPKKPKSQALNLK